MCLYSFDWNNSNTDHVIIVEKPPAMCMQLLYQRVSSSRDKNKSSEMRDLSREESVLGLILYNPSSFHSGAAQAVKNQVYPVLRTHRIVC